VQDGLPSVRNVCCSGARNFKLPFQLNANSSVSYCFRLQILFGANLHIESIFFKNCVDSPTNVSE